MGYEKLMRCPGGIFANRCLFIMVNMIIVLSWTVQLMQEERKASVENEIRLWDSYIEWLEQEMSGVGGIEVCSALSL